MNGAVRPSSATAEQRVGRSIRFSAIRRGKPSSRGSHSSRRHSRRGDIRGGCRPASMGAGDHRRPIRSPRGLLRLDQPRRHPRARRHRAGEPKLRRTYEAHLGREGWELASAVAGVSRTRPCPSADNPVKRRQEGRKSPSPAGVASIRRPCLDRNRCRLAAFPFTVARSPAQHRRPKPCRGQHRIGGVRFDNALASDFGRSDQLFARFDLDGVRVTAS